MAQVKVTRCRINGEDFEVELQAEMDAQLKVDVSMPPIPTFLWVMPILFSLAIGILIGVSIAS